MSLADELLFEAVRLAPAKRQRFLAEACAGDNVLLREILSLLDAHERAQSFLEDRPLTLDLTDFTDAGEAGREVGVYRLLERLGRGGMGEVYLGERADDAYHKRVAVKLIKRGMDSDEIVDRFQQERQVLADLEHPNVARLLDGGTTDDGRPYLVMEHVEGRTIDRFCSEERLAFTQRLELFIHVCTAVQYAHRNLVVHRDLKPANVLVDGDGQVKLLDFGIAKILSRDGSEASVATELGQRPMTPHYAAPEQVLGQRVTTATDVYSLGVMLYELLTGARPIALGDSTQEELRRKICEEEPTRPSVAVLDASPPHWVATMGVDRRTLSRRLAGDLDNAVSKALEKDPERRYASAEQLAADLRRHLSGLPILARPGSLRYRTLKFARRNAKAVGAAALVAAALVAATVISVALYLGAEGARRSAEQARVEAETQARTAAAVSSFLEEMLASVDPVASQRREEITVRQFLDEAAARIPTELGGEPAVAAALQATIGSAYRNLTLHQEAERNLVAALEKRRRRSAEEPQGLIDVLLQLGQSHQFAGRFDEAEGLYQEALTASRRLAEDEALWSARSRYNLALLSRAQGEYEAAEALLRQALEGLESVGGEDVAEAHRALGLLLNDRGRYGEAEEAMRQALAGKRETRGPDHSSVGQTLNDLAWVLISDDRHEDARPLLEEAVTIYEGVYPEHHPKTAITRANLASTLREMGRFAEAETAMVEALDDFRVSLGPDHPHVGHTLNNLATVLEMSGDPERAVVHFGEAMALYRRELGDRHPFVGAAQFNLARALRKNGQLALAERECRANLELRREILRQGHPDVARPLALLGQLLMDREDHEGAVPLLEESLDIRLAALGTDHGLTGWSRALLGVAETARGRYPVAETQLLAGFATLREAHGAEHHDTRYAESAIHNLYRAWGRPESAKEYRQQ